MFLQASDPTGTLFLFAIGLAAFLLFVLLLRAVGAWMLRINDVIDQLRAIRQELKEIKEAGGIRKERKEDHKDYQPRS